MTVAFRAARPDDLDAIHALRRAFYAEDGSPWDEAPARLALGALLVDECAGRVWVAEDREMVVGYVALAFGFSLEFHGRDAFVDELYLQPRYRRRGLGAAALRIVESTCRAAGVRALHLEVDHDNEAARGLYHAWGFAAHGRQLMTKWLSSRGEA